MYFFLIDPSIPGVGGGVAKLWPNNMLGEKIIERGGKRGGAYFSPFGKKYAYFPPNLIMTSNIQNCKKQRMKMFRLRRAPPHYNKCHSWKNMNFKRPNVSTARLIRDPQLWPKGDFWECFYRCIKLLYAKILQKN